MRTSTFKANINSILRDNAITRYSHNQKKGKINTKRLYKIEMSEKIFKQKLERKGKDYSISTLIDLSGSTAGMRNEMLQAVDNFEKVFEELEIPTSIYFFSNVTRQAKVFTEKYNQADLHELTRTFTGQSRKNKRTRYADCNSCKIHDVEFDSNSKCIHCKSYVSVNNGGDGRTKDSIALYTVATQIHKHQKKNILIVLTDGSGDMVYGDFKYQTQNSPVNMKDLASAELVLKKLKRMYPELIVVAVPIATSPTYCQRYYGRRNTEHAPRVEDAYPAVVKLIKRHIQRK